MAYYYLHGARKIPSGRVLYQNQTNRLPNRPTGASGKTGDDDASSAFADEYFRLLNPPGYSPWPTCFWTCWPKWSW